MAELIPHGTLHVVEGGGHLFLFTRAEEMAGLIREFCAAPVGAAAA